MFDDQNRLNLVVPYLGPSMAALLVATLFNLMSENAKGSSKTIFQFCIFGVVLILSSAYATHQISTDYITSSKIEEETQVIIAKGDPFCHYYVAESKKANEKNRLVQHKRLTENPC